MREVIQFLALWLILAAVWLIYTMDFHVQSMLLGLVCSLATAAFSFHVFYHQSKPGYGKLVYRWDLLVLYLVLLILQSYLASFTLIRQMLTGSYRSGVVRIKTRINSPIGRTLLANSISLVPGTLSLWLEGNYIYVHWFDQKSRHRLESGRMIKEPMEGILMKLFG